MTDEMTNCQQGDAREDVLEGNLRRLIVAAPERARLDDAARDRMAAALRAHVSAGPSAGPTEGAAKSTTGPAPLHLLRSPMVRLAAAAAAILLIVLGVRRFTPDAEDIHVAGGGALTTPDVTGAPGDHADDPGGAPDGGHEVAPRPNELEPVAHQGTGGGGRTAAGDGDATGAQPAVFGDSAAADLPPGTIRAQVILDPSIEALPETIIVWVKPMLDLPQVADPVAHTVDLVYAEGGGAAASFVLSGALAPARARGADEVLIQVEVPGAAPARATASLNEIAESALTFTFAPGVTLEGFVVDARTGTPIAGAFVVALNQLPLDAISVAPDNEGGFPRPYATADANGAFKLMHVIPAKNVLVSASHAGFAPATQNVQIGAEAPAALRIALPQGGTVTGTVEHPDGTRWEGALIVASSQTDDPTASPRPTMTAGFSMTDASGKYRIEDLPKGVYVVLLFGDPTAANPAPLGFMQTVVRGTGERTVDFLAQTSTSGSSFTGTFVDEDGQPIAGAALTLTGAGDGTDSQSNWRATESAEDGSFAFVGVDTGAYVLHVATQSYLRLDLVWRGTVDGPTERTVTLAGSSWSLACQSVADQEPCEGVWVIVELYDEALSSWLFGGRGTTDSEGVITYPHLPPGRYRVTASGVGPGLGHVRLDAVELTAGTALRTVVPIPAGGVLQIEVLDAPGGAPVNGAVVIIGDSGGVVVPQPRVVTTNARGEAQNLSVAFGEVTVIVRRVGGPKTIVTLQFEAGGPGEAEPFTVILDQR